MFVFIICIKCCFRVYIVKRERGNYILIGKKLLKLCLVIKIMVVYVENIWLNYFF